MLYVTDSYAVGRRSWLGRLPVWVLPLVLALLQVGAAYLAQKHAGAGGPPWHGDNWRTRHWGTDSGWEPGPRGGSDATPTRPVDVWAYLMLVLGPACMVYRRRWRGPALAAAIAVDGVYFAFGYASFAFLSLIVALVLAVLYGQRLLAWIACPISYVLIVWSAPIFGRGPGPSAEEGIVPFAWPLLILIAAEVVRLVRDRIAANARARAEEERLRHEETRRRASEERLRIAQELHDVLAHNISMINVQASTALHLLDDQPERARPSLSAIKDASKEALVELRSALDVLRQSGERAPRAPTAGLDELDALVERTRSAGLVVDVAIDGTRDTPPAGVDLAAFRIVQEALTNVVRHADARHVTVRIGYLPSELTVEVTDDGTASGPVVTGNGISGMRERAATLGGDLTAGARPGGGFAVRARLPIREGARTKGQP